jgi:hypothetical protein
LHEVGGGGGSQGVEAMEQTGHEEDQRLGWLRDFQRTLLEGAVLEGTTQIDAVRGGERFEGSADVLAESFGGPDGAGGEESGEDGLRADGAPAEDAARNDARRGAAEGADRGGLFSRIAEPLAGDGGLDLEDGIDALGGNVQAGVVRKERRRIEVVEDGDVDLAGPAAVGIYDEGGGGR